VSVASKYQDVLELDKVREVFPYGNIRFQIQDGGMVATNGKVIAEMGDKNEDVSHLYQPQYTPANATLRLLKPLLYKHAALRVRW